MYVNKWDYDFSYQTEQYHVLHFLIRSTKRPSCNKMCVDIKNNFFDKYDTIGIFVKSLKKTVPGNCIKEKLKYTFTTNLPCGYFI